MKLAQVLTVLSLFAAVGIAHADSAKVGVAGDNGTHDCPYNPNNSKITDAGLKERLAGQSTPAQPTSGSGSSGAVNEGGNADTGG